MRLKRFTCNFHVERMGGRRFYGLGWYLCKGGGEYFLFRPYREEGIS